jgi:hypothetical protein
MKAVRPEAPGAVFRPHCGFAGHRYYVVVGHRSSCRIGFQPEIERTILGKFGNLRGAAAISGTSPYDPLPALEPAGEGLIVEAVGVGRPSARSGRCCQRPPTGWRVVLAGSGTSAGRSLR